MLVRGIEGIAAMAELLPSGNAEYKEDDWWVYIGTGP